MGKRIRILFVFYNLKVGGAETEAKLIIENLDKTIFKVEIATIIEGGEIADELTASGFKVKFCDPQGTKLSFRNIVGLYKIIKMGQYTIVYSWLPRANFLATIIGKVCGVPVIINSERSSTVNPHPIFKLLYKLTNYVNDKLTTNSEYMRQYLISNHLAYANKTLVTYNGMKESGDHSISRERIKASLFIEGEQKIIGIIARLWKQKAHEVLFKALKKILAIRNNVKLLVIGEGPRQDELQQLARELEIQDHVIFTGLRRDVQSLLKLIDVSVLSSTFGEGVPCVIIESLLAKVPFVATSVGGIPEIIKHNINGYLVPSNDPQNLAEGILKILEDKKYAQKLSEAGYQIAKEKFSLAAMIRTNQKLYLDLVDQKAATTQRNF